MDEQMKTAARGKTSTLFFGLGQSITLLLGIIGVVNNPDFKGWMPLVIVVSAIITGGMLSAAFLPAVNPFRRLVKAVTRSKFGMVVPGLLSLLACVGGIGVILTIFRLVDIKKDAWFVPFFLLWPWFTLGLLLVIASDAQAGVRKLIVNLTALLVSLIFFIVFLEGTLQLAYSRLPSTITGRMPQAVTRLYNVLLDTASGAREHQPGEAVTTQEGGSTGDMFFKSCLSPKDALDPSYQISFIRDEHGFRNKSPWPENAEVVVIGDSFTHAGSVEQPYWQGLSPALLSLGTSATGTLEQNLVLRAYGLPRSPRVVILAYYEGNDLTDNFEFFNFGSAQKQNEKWLNSQPIRNFSVIFNTFAWLRDSLNVKSCYWPIEDSQGRKLAFLEEDLSLSTVSPAQLQQSEVYQITRDAIVNMAGEVEATGATFVLAFIPHKLHAYWNGVVEAGQIETIAAHIAPWELPERGYFTVVGDASAADTAGRLTAGIDAQRDLLARLAAEQGFDFLDFTVPLQAAIDQGSASPYFFGDSHWNQEGNDLAREVLRAYLSKHGLISGER